VKITDGTGTVSLTRQLASSRLFTSFGSGITAKTAKGRDRAEGPRKAKLAERIIRPDVPVFVVGKPSYSGTGVVLGDAWLRPLGTSTLPIAQVRHRFAVRLIRVIAMLFGLPTLGLALML
jgi:hypothetical protein